MAGEWAEFPAFQRKWSRQTPQKNDIMTQTLISGPKLEGPNATLALVMTGRVITVLVSFPQLNLWSMFFYLPPRSLRSPSLLR